MGALSEVLSGSAGLASLKIARRREVVELMEKDNEYRARYKQTLLHAGERCYALFEEGNVEDEELLEICERLTKLRISIDTMDAKIMAANEKYEQKRNDRIENRLR